MAYLTFRYLKMTWEGKWRTASNWRLGPSGLRSAIKYPIDIIRWISKG